MATSMSAITNIPSVRETAPAYTPPRRLRPVAQQRINVTATRETLDVKKMAGRIAISLVLLMLGNLFITALQAGAIYQISELKKQVAETAITDQVLTMQLEKASSLAALDAKARKLGMVKSTRLDFLRVSNGHVVTIKAVTNTR